MTTTMRLRIAALLFGTLPLLAAFLTIPGTARAQTDGVEAAETRGCPAGWVSSSAPGGCSPGFFTLKLARLPDAPDCPDGWVASSAPGGCSPGFFTLRLSDAEGDGGCPDGWVRSSAPGGCSPGHLTLKLAGLEPVTEGCPDGWIESSAPGGCSPEGFTLKERRIQQASYTCAFGVACDVMVEAILALGGSCTRDGPDSTCDLPPLVED